MRAPEISNVTWSSKGVTLVYTDAKVAYLSGADLYPLAEDAKVTPINSQLNDLSRKAS